jgi:hypothetical protein
VAGSGSGGPVKEPRVARVREGWPEMAWRRHTGGGWRQRVVRVRKEEMLCRTNMTGGTNTSERRRMNRRLKDRYGEPERGGE